MKEKIKKIVLGYLPGFITGIIVCGTVSVIAATYFPSREVIYDNGTSGMHATDVQGAIDEIYKTCTEKPSGSDTITDLLPSNSDELYKDEHGDIRYYGKNPNNYVLFNNELWRIIGVIDGKIKIVRNELLPSVTTDNGVKIGTSDGFYWNSQQQFLKYYNTWEGATLQTYLNGTYYNSINSIYKKMISEETYYLGGPSWENWDILTASGYYDIERSDAVYSGNSTIKQNIGLMYPSDYGYAAGNNCLSTYLYNYDSNCKDSDYLFNGVNEWLQSPTSNNDNFSDTITNTGVVGPQVVNRNSLAVRPTLYLSSKTIITGGDGSQSNPFQLSL